MKKVLVLIPVYNDWDSLKKLLNEIDFHINNIKEFEFNCIVVNDSSSENMPVIKKPLNFNFLKVLHMKENKGHARSNAFGLRYIFQNEDFNFVILMDGDGEDRPEELQSMISQICENPEISVVAKRIKRSEGVFFKSLYEIHKLITYLFTGKKIHFGNYSCLTKKDVGIIHKKPSLWSSYSGTIKKNIKKLNEVNSIRGMRYIGPSKMSLINLILHSLSIIAVFKYIVLFRSFLATLILTIIFPLKNAIYILFLTIFILFNAIIFLVSTRENEKNLKESNNNLDKISDIIH